MTNILKYGIATIVVGAAALTASSATARRGADDPAGHVRQCRGCDDAPGDVRRGRGADDPADHDANDDKGGDRARAAGDSRRRDDSATANDRGQGQGRGRGRGRGGDDAPGDDRGGRGADDPS